MNEIAKLVTACFVCATKVLTNILHCHYPTKPCTCYFSSRSNSAVPPFSALI